MLNNPRVRAMAAGVINVPARGLVRLGVSPDAITVLGTLGVVVAAAGFLARGSWSAGPSSWACCSRPATSSTVPWRG